MAEIGSLIDFQYIPVPVSPLALPLVLYSFATNGSSVADRVRSRITNTVFLSPCLLCEGRADVARRYTIR